MRLHFSVLAWQRLELILPPYIFFANKNQKKFKKFQHWSIPVTMVAFYVHCYRDSAPIEDRGISGI